MIPAPKHPASGGRTSLLHALDRSFLFAYLLTRNAAQAEKAVLQAIEKKLDLDKLGEQHLLESTARVAAQIEVDTSGEPYEEGTPDICLPIELRSNERFGCP